MLMREYKNSDKMISVLGLGCMRLPKITPDREDIDYEKAQEMVDYALSHGINYVDTAHMYHNGESEVFLGHALQKHQRESFYLATKMPIWMAKTPEEMRKIFDLQLERLQTDYIDFYLWHALNKENFKRCIDFGLYEFLTEKKKQGAIRYLGFSFHDAPDTLEEICDTYDWDFAQIQLNYLDWEMQDAKRQYGILEKHDIPCIIMEPVRGGTLANPCEAANKLFLEARPQKSIASWAMRYAATFPNVLTVLSGMSNMEQLKDNIDTMDHFEPIDDKDSEVIEKAVLAYKTKDTVPCTGCRYCMDCVFGVDIPNVFKQYNQYAVNQNKDIFKKEFDSSAAHCTACGKCAEHCPQAIKIPEKIAMINNLYQD
ncbi:MAG: aldo/keto reductase [Oscillospiraceae bacterium]|jgi:predicted aldo/keto reductase-like oxidoreductase|nr:aldo/keto reductase [Oscillospiraceae bacterium]